MVLMEFTYQWNPEWAEDEAMPVLKITKSSLNTFEYCEKQYLYNYIERRPQETSPAMLKGTIVHNSYEDFYNEFDIKKAESMDYNTLYDYCMGLFPIDDYHDMYQTMAAFETERFITARKNNTIEQYIPAGNEIQCNARITIAHDANPKFFLQRDYEVHLQGIIDRVFLEGDGYIPIELKTGGWKARKATAMRKEMAFYKFLMDSDPNCTLDPVSHWGWYFPAANHFEVESVKNRNVNDIPKRIAKLIHAYETGLFPASYYPAKCSYCSYVGICDTAQGNEMWGW